MAGVLLILARSAPDASARNPVLGNLLMFASVVVWGVYTMLAKRLADEDALAITACVAAMGTFLLVPPALVEAARAPLPAITAAGWLRIAYLGAFPSALCYLLFSRALRDLDASQVGAFINLIPVIGVASGVAFLGETMTPFAIAGGALVFAGVWISSRGASGQAAATATSVAPPGPRLGPHDEEPARIGGRDDGRAGAPGPAREPLGRRPGHALVVRHARQDHAAGVRDLVPDRGEPRAGGREVAALRGGPSHAGRRGPRAPAVGRAQHVQAGTAFGARPDQGGEPAGRARRARERAGRLGTAFERPAERARRAPACPAPSAVARSRPSTMSRGPLSR